MSQQVSRKINLFGVVNTPEIEIAAINIIRSGRIANGPHVSAFEFGLSKLFEQQHIVCTINMTSALHLALYMSGVRSGDDVVTSAFACMATNSSIAAIGARPVWVDLEPQAAYIDTAQFESVITPRTKAAIIYHLAGYPSPSNKIAEICQKHGIKLIEDCDNAAFATIGDKFVGSFGDFAVYSFYPNRQINTIEGGALTCRDSNHAAEARKLRYYGINSSLFRLSTGEIDPECDIPVAGWSMGMNNLSAAIGCQQLQSVRARVYKTRANVELLKNWLSDITEIQFIKEFPNTVSAYWVLLIQVDFRDKILEKLKIQGIMCSTLHQRNDKYSCFLPSIKKLPNTEKLQSKIIAIPCGWWLDEMDLKYIVESLKIAICANC